MSIPKRGLPNAYEKHSSKTAAKIQIIHETTKFLPHISLFVFSDVSHVDDFVTINAVGKRIRM